MMISKVKNAMSTLVGGMMPHGHHHHHHNHHSGGGGTCGPDSLPPRFPYGRPDFLDLTPELLQYSTEHASRPVLTLKRDSRLSWRTGYAEWVDQCVCPWTEKLKHTHYTHTQIIVVWSCASRGASGPAVLQPQQLRARRCRQVMAQHGLMLFNTFHHSDPAMSWGLDICYKLKKRGS